MRCRDEGRAGVIARCRDEGYVLHAIASIPRMLWMHTAYGLTGLRLHTSYTQAFVAILYTSSRGARYAYTDV